MKISTTNRIIGNTVNVQREKKKKHIISFFRRHQKILLAVVNYLSITIYIYHLSYIICHIMYMYSRKSCEHVTSVRGFIANLRTNIAKQTVQEIPMIVRVAILELQ